MQFIQFYTRAVTDPKKLIPACGDRAVIIVDGREREMAHHKLAQYFQMRRGYEAYRLMKGETFTRAEPTTGVFMTPEMMQEGCYHDD